MKDSEKEIIKFHLTNKFYFLEYPKPTSKNLWKDGEGKFHTMSDMGLDHLNNSIGVVNKGIDYIEGHPYSEEVKKFLLKAAKEKIKMG